MTTQIHEFEEHGYHIEKQLGINRPGGRVTYLATRASDQLPVVIKHFQFATSDNGWSDYDAHHREIEVLQGLEHPGIPKYLESFQTAKGFCMVQEYKEAVPLSKSHSFDPEQIRQIAVSVLDILVYLQNRMPAVIHRDIKPDNILIDQGNNIFLVDFGFARVGDGEVGVSSVVKGTLGFMPPEQLFNRQLTEASDLYGLGMTLICLITGTKTDEIGNLVDISYQVKFKHLVPKLSFQWVRWLEKMVEPRTKDRFANAIAAREALPAASIRPPELQLSQVAFDLKATEIGETLVQTVAVKNPISDTLLKGHWEIKAATEQAAKPWISVSPQEFEGNETMFQIKVDTRRLRADHRYEQTLVLHTNANPEQTPITLTTQTAPLPIQTEAISYQALGFLFVAVLLLARINFGIAGGFSDTPATLPLAVLSNVIGIGIGMEASAWTLGATGSRMGAIASGITGVICLVLVLGVWLSSSIPTGALMLVLMASVLGLCFGWVAGLLNGMVTEKLTDGDASPALSMRLAVLTTILATSIASGLTFSFAYWGIGLAIALSALPLVTLLIHTPLRRNHLISQYRRMERRRIGR
ncbi:MAG: protein kinase [Cyanobacteria bacterium J06638_20]